MDSSYSYTYTSTDPATAGAAIGLIFVIWLVMFALVALPGIITLWKLFAKAGKPGWASLVPFYNVYVMLEIAKLPAWYLVLYFVPLVNIVVMVMLYVNFIKQYKGSVGFWVTYFLLPIVAVFMVKGVAYGEADVASMGPVAPMPVAPSMPATAAAEISSEAAIGLGQAVEPSVDAPAQSVLSAPEEPVSTPVEQIAPIELVSAPEIAQVKEPEPEPEQGAVTTEEALPQPEFVDPEIPVEQPSIVEPAFPVEPDAIPEEDKPTDGTSQTPSVS